MGPVEQETRHAVARLDPLQPARPAHRGKTLAHRIRIDLDAQEFRQRFEGRKGNARVVDLVPAGQRQA